MLRPQLSQHDCLALFDRDRSTWAEVKFYPDTVTCRRMLRFADWAANFPQCYYAARRKLAQTGRTSQTQAKNKGG